MATAEQVVRISNPSITVNGVLIAIIANSAKTNVPGEINVTAVSAGGSSVATVNGVDASTLIAMVSFELPNTAQGIALATQWKAQSVGGVGNSITISAPTYNQALSNMVLENEIDVELSAEGNLECIFKGARSY